MTHWKKLTNPNYLGAYSIENGQDLILTIDHVREETVIGADGKKDDCVVCHFKGNVKPMILNATNMKRIEKLYKTPFVENWAGKKIQVGKEKVNAFGEIVDALRVRKIVPVETAPTKVICDCCGKEITAIGGKTAEQIAAYTKQKYGAALCVACATQAKKDAEEVTENENDEN